jgi:hypothetical protein
MDPSTDWVVSGGKGALDFDGSNDVVRCTVNNFLQKTTPFTLSAWVYAKSTNVQMNIFSTWKYNQQSGWQFFVDVSNTPSVAFLSLGATYYQANSKTLLSINKWTHILCTSFGANFSNVEFFINGVNGGKTTPITNDPGALDSKSLSIGAREANVSYNDTFLNGQIDDIRIYSRALSESEIRLLASERGIGLKPERLRNRYPAPTPSRNRSSRFLGFPA